MGAAARRPRCCRCAKLIVTLRNPVDRAYSQFQMSRREGRSRSRRSRTRSRRRMSACATSRNACARSSLQQLADRMLVLPDAEQLCGADRALARALPARATPLHVTEELEARRRRRSTPSTRSSSSPRIVRLARASACRTALRADAGGGPGELVAYFRPRNERLYGSSGATSAGIAEPRGGRRRHRRRPGARPCHRRGVRGRGRRPAPDRPLRGASTGSPIRSRRRRIWTRPPSAAAGSARGSSRPRPTCAVQGEIDEALRAGRGPSARSMFSSTTPASSALPGLRPTSSTSQAWSIMIDVDLTGPVAVCEGGSART